MKLNRLKGEQAQLAGEAAKGKGDKPRRGGRGVSPINDKLKGITAEINSLEGGSESAAALHQRQNNNRVATMRILRP